MEIVSGEALAASVEALRTQVGDPREGILGPRSLAWRLGGELGIFLGGGRAALLQLAHPMVAHAIAAHSRTRRDVAGRFQRTFTNVFAMVFGELDAAIAAARRVHAVHARIHGVMPAAVGGWPAGSPYHANALEALIWVHTTLVDTVMVTRTLLAGAIAEADRDRYVIEMHRFAALFGIPCARLPQSGAEHDAYLRTMLASDRIAVAPCARELARFLVGRDAEPQPVLGRLGEALTGALLPAHLATAYGLRTTPRRTRAGLAAFRAVYRALPARARALPAAATAHHRLAGTEPGAWAAWAERQLVGLARRTSGSGA